jgi:hypothetical protein
VTQAVKVKRIGLTRAWRSPLHLPSAQVVQQYVMSRVLTDRSFAMNESSQSAVVRPRLRCAVVIAGTGYCAGLARRTRYLSTHPRGQLSD